MAEVIFDITGLSEHPTEQIEPVLLEGRGDQGGVSAPVCQGGVVTRLDLHRVGCARQGLGPPLEQGQVDGAKMLALSEES